MPDGGQAVVVLAPVRTQVVAQVKQRPLQYPALAQQQRDQQPPDAPVPIEEGVNGLELRVGQPTVNQYRQ